jgi:ElaB/YqjD/DUF883 family membrane-anchored ribosome-binding protein
MSTSKTIATQPPVTEQAIEAGKSLIGEQSEQLQRALAEAGELAREGIHKAQRASQALRDQCSQAGDRTVGYIREEPVKSVLIAAAVGAGVAALIGWLGSRRR